MQNSTASLRFKWSIEVILDNKFKGKGDVCFIDVLGFSADIINNWDSSENNP